MKNGEIFTVVKALDTRWGKWAPRGEEKQKKCILGTIRKARIKYPEGTLNLDDIDEEIPWMSARELRAKEIQVEWIVPGYIQKKGVFFLVSDSGVGKTHMSLMIACHMALGKPYLGFDIQKPSKVAFIQMEYSDAELKEELDRIYNLFEADEQEVILNNLDVIPKGSSINLRSERIREMLLRRVDQFKPEGIFWDSFQVAMGGKLIESEPLNDAFDFVKKELGNKRNIFNWFIHHNRKDESTRVQRKRPKELDDVYGGQAIGAVCTMVMGLWKESPGDPEIQATCLKARWAPKFEKFVIRRPESGVGFERVVSLGQRMYMSESAVSSPGDSHSPGFETNIDF
jgi:RecA-family ATPase